MLRLLFLPALVLASDLRLNQIRYKGTHNSYHIEPDIPLSQGWRYTHDSLTVQLEEQSVRAFELDVHQIPLLPLRVYHLPVVDSKSTCDTFCECLQEIRDWSNANPYHVPVWVWVEEKDDVSIVQPDLVLDEIDECIYDTFPASKLITPKDVRGGATTLHDAIKVNGWPTVDESRGKVGFVLLNRDSDYVDAYRPDQDDRPMFMNCNFIDPTQTWPGYCAMTKVDDLPTDSAGAVSKISHALDDNMIVGTNLCLAKDVNGGKCDDELDVALNSGTHLLFDDFPEKVSGLDYYMPDTVFGCNDVVLDNTPNAVDCNAPDCSIGVLRCEAVANVNSCGGCSTLTTEQGTRCGRNNCGTSQCSANQMDTYCDESSCPSCKGFMSKCSSGSECCRGGCRGWWTKRCYYF